VLSSNRKVIAVDMQAHGRTADIYRPRRATSKGMIFGGLTTEEIARGFLVSEAIAQRIVRGVELSIR
jgi:hypothetical protein